MGIYDIITQLWFIQLIISIIITSFVVAILHTRSGYERIVCNAESTNEFEEYAITGCSFHISNILIITAEKKDDYSNGIIVAFRPRPVIGYMDSCLSEQTITSPNRRTYTLPKNTDKYIIKIKSKSNGISYYSMEHEWNGIELTQYLILKLKNILKY